MTRTTLLAGIGLAAIIAGAAGYLLWPAALAQIVAVTPPSPMAFVPADAQTTAIVAAADAFLATLTAEQQDLALFDWTDATQRMNWSNFPQGGAGVERLGLAWGAMDDTQRAALTAMLGTVLSVEGAQMMLEQVAADDIVAEAEGTGASVSFGSDYYFVSILGNPSTTTPFAIQFGGHHLGLNATIVGANVTLSPSLTGGQPLRFTLDGAEVYVVEREAVEAAAMLASLTEDQKAIAVRSMSMSNLVLGPGQDGLTLVPEGLAGVDMTDGQKAQLLRLIEARLGILNADDLAATMIPITTNLDATYFGWWGPAEPIGAAYVRITGPNLVIEFSPQADDGDPTDHAHNMYRDPTNEYGAAWTALE
jgi:hypothetical protein